MTTTTPSTSQNQQLDKGGSGGKLRRRLAGLFGENSPSPSGFRRLGSALLWGVAPLLVGLWLAQSMVPQPAVGVIRLYGDIYVESADYVMAQLEAARSDPDIAAVVVRLDSPGGEVAASQQLFLELQDLRQFHTYSDPRRDPRRHTISTVFAAKVQGNPRAGDDAGEVGIFGEENLPLPLAFDHEQILRDYFEKKRSAVGCQRSAKGKTDG